MYGAPLGRRVAQLLEHPAGAGPGVASGPLGRDRHQWVSGASAPGFFAPGQEYLERGNQTEGVDLLAGEAGLGRRPVLETSSHNVLAHVAPIGSRSQRMDRPAGTPVIPWSRSD